MYDSRKQIPHIQREIVLGKASNKNKLRHTPIRRKDILQCVQSNRGIQEETKIDTVGNHRLMQPSPRWNSKI